MGNFGGSLENFGKNLGELWGILGEYLGSPKLPSLLGPPSLKDCIIELGSIASATTVELTELLSFCWGSSLGTGARGYVTGSRHVFLISPKSHASSLLSKGLSAWPEL